MVQDDLGRGLGGGMSFDVAQTSRISGLEFLFLRTAILSHHFMKYAVYLVV